MTHLMRIGLAAACLLAAGVPADAARQLSFEVRGASDQGAWGASADPPGFNPPDADNDDSPIDLARLRTRSFYDGIGSAIDVTTVPLTPDITLVIFQWPNIRPGSPKTLERVSVDIFDTLTQSKRRVRVYWFDRFAFNLIATDPLKPEFRPLPGFEGDRFDVHIGVVPEPATWAMLIAGFGLVGLALRCRRPLPAGV